ncbi:hypothetical protein SPRG_10571 [Saprolegnia parasitica CBS 223.65]|uniref:Attractin/MKLN-like beta-propeller domain-containing protein n=1 Tax=Saprolegnia parasitica (strain CBS 223.65) TaxID=695850 RepID=A0A067C046_SAPPC|nr:hypothetical protein SPRG_10571 [Saprolegnia parasitica CBS 223.65]KDO24144.1 hypothetical protein SPRG_10571 [Saprolegnia parasitica CBS 223.65]|eukprot:XP_012205088.1 hypothetical protein SPRG_10571 [Saprolegnia parasitica CBS 223.65]
MQLFEPEPEYIDERRWERIETLGEGYSPRTGHTVVSYGATLYVFGGTDRRRRQQDLFQFDIESCMWSQVDVNGTLPPRRSGALGVVHENNMYIFGGYDGRDGNYFNDLFFFNFETRKWSEMPNLSIVKPESRTDHIMVLHASNIYIFGGYNGSSRFNNMYRYELLEKRWRKMDATGQIPSGRFGHSGAVHEASKRLVIFGGWDGRDTLDDLYEYHLETGVWAVMKTTGKSPPHRYRHTAVIYEDSMFVFGGVDKAHSRFNDLQRLDLVTNTWSEVYTSGYVPSSRTFHRAVVVTNRMYLLGGYDGTDRLHDLYSIHVGPLSPPSLLNLCAAYTRHNVDRILEHHSFRGVPYDVLGQVIFRRDGDNDLRGKCTVCRDGRCSLYKLSRMPAPESAPPARHLRSRDRPNKHVENTMPCVCGHGNGLHELIDERKLFGDRVPMNDTNGKSKVLLLYNLYKRIFDGPIPPSAEHPPNQASSA